MSRDGSNDRIDAVRIKESYKIRQVFISRDGERYRLVPGNPIYEEEEVTARETVIFKICEMDAGFRGDVLGSVLKIKCPHF